VIEWGSFAGAPSVTIRSHHNIVDPAERLNLTN
jgi:hypothetical protein